MRFILAIVIAVAALAAKADDRLHIEEQMYLLTLPVAAADDPAVEVLRRDFDLMRGDTSTELRVITGPVFAQAIFGRVIALNTRIASMPSGERLFIIAHEIAHVVHRDYERWRETPWDIDTESARSWQQELAADAYALRAIKRYGYTLETAVAQFMRFGLQQDGPTHPGTRKRIAHLREVDGA